MKNKIFIALLLSISTFLLISSCKKKASEEPAQVGKCETKYEVLFGEAVSTNETTSAGYENGQIRTLNSSSFNFVYEYAQDRVNITSAGKPYYRIDISNSLATKFTDLKNLYEQRLSYDANRNLVKIESYDNGNLADTKILNYSNGNLITLTQTFTDDPAVKKVTTFSYFPEIAGKIDSETSHLVFGNAEPTIPLFLLGSTSKNILKESQYTYTSGNFRSDVIKLYVYTRGNNNTNKIVENSQTVTVSNGIQTQNETLKRTILINSTCP